MDIFPTVRVAPGSLVDSHEDAKTRLMMASEPWPCGGHKAGCPVDECSQEECRRLEKSQHSHRDEKAPHRTMSFPRIDLVPKSHPAGHNCVGLRRCIACPSWAQDATFGI